MLHPTSPRTQYLLATAEQLAVQLAPVDALDVVKIYTTPHNIALQDRLGYSPSVLTMGQRRKLAADIVAHARYLQVSK